MPTYIDTLNAFTAFLTAYTHTLLYLRTLYPRTSFVHSRFHNTSAYQSRHPLVCEWIRDAIDAVRTELLAGTVSRIAIVIFSYGPSSPSPSESSTGTGTGSVQIIERFMLGVDAFPAVSKDARNASLEWASSRPSSRDSSRSGSPHDDDDDDDDSELPPTRSESHEPPPLDHGVDVNLAEQFRGALIALTTRCAQLAPLPDKCSFNISMELKDEADVDPPLGHPQAWIPVQPSLQKTGRSSGKRATVEEEGDARKTGEDLGGVRVTPIRTVEAGTFRFETWVEEGRAKLEGKGKAKVNFSSSGD
ncbi:DNA-binding protein [Lizonia empirigonia]|nr:DNA-binding protein [Lizonia empirigonia]